jgi:hypothetical protein
MNIEIIQQSIVTQLQAAFTASSLLFTAENIPESEAGYRKAVPNPIAYVVYTGSTSPGVRSSNPVIQDRKLQFSVECLSRVLYGPNGLLKVRDYVELALIGFKPVNCDRMYLVKDDIDRADDSIWAHVFQFECITMLVQNDLSDPVVVPNLQTLTAKFENASNPGDAGNGTQTIVIPVNQ